MRSWLRPRGPLAVLRRSSVKQASGAFFLLCDPGSLPAGLASNLWHLSHLRSEVFPPLTGSISGLSAQLASRNCECRQTCTHKPVCATLQAMNLFRPLAGDGEHTLRLVLLGSLSSMASCLAPLAVAKEWGGFSVITSGRTASGKSPPSQGR